MTRSAHFAPAAVQPRPRLALRLAALLAAGAALAGPVSALAAPGPCDRACMSGMADALVGSMVKHRPAAVPLTATYRATENGIAGGLPMMGLWRTPTAAKARFYAIDPQSQQMFIQVELREGGVDSLLFGRLKVEGRAFSELELYVARSRAESGFQYEATNLGKLPDVWTKPVAANRLMAREDLLRVGRSMFDKTIESPPAGPDCYLMENAKVVGEELEMMEFMLPAGAPMPKERNPDGSVPMQCPIFPDRPVDKDARVDVVDVEQGVVVSIATIHGLVQPYPVTKPTWSAFVPYDLMAMYADALKRIAATGRYTAPNLVATPASITVAQSFRIYDGKVQGMHMLERMGPPNATSPWTK